MSDTPKSFQPNDAVVISLSKAEALVLFEWLSRTDSRDALSFEHDAEEATVWRLHGQLEKMLVEPLVPEYKQIVELARKAVTDRR